MIKIQLSYEDRLCRVLRYRELFYKENLQNHMLLWSVRFFESHWPNYNKYVICYDNEDVVIDRYGKK